MLFPDRYPLGCQHLPKDCIPSKNTIGVSFPPVRGNLMQCAPKSEYRCDSLRELSFGKGLHQSNQHKTFTAAPISVLLQGEPLIYSVRIVTIGLRILDKIRTRHPTLKTSIVKGSILSL